MINPEDLLKDDLYYIMNGFTDVTEELNKQGVYAPRISRWGGRWEMNGYEYESFNKKIYRRLKRRHKESDKSGKRKRQ